MNNEKMGQFIAELRKSHQMTQKDLAEKLDVSDKAVSKWERGLSCPDISLLSPLSNLLGITASELLNGERTDTKTLNVETSVTNALEYVDKTAKSKLKLAQSILATIFSISILLGIFVVSIVDLAISDAFTWSLIPISASVFAWLVCFPAIKFGSKGILGSLITLSLFLIPFLYLLDHVINRLDPGHVPLFSMAIRIAPISIAFCWLAFLLFKKCKARKLLALAVLALLSSPLSFLINFMIARALGQPYLLDVWTAFNVSTPILVAIILFMIDLLVQRRDRL